MCARSRPPAATERRRPGRFAAALALAALAAGCATPGGRELPAFDGWEARRAALSRLGSYGFTGRIAVRSGDDGFNGNLHWEQRRDYFDVRVSGPLGAGTVRIAGDPGSVSVTDNDGEVTDLDDPEFALANRYGWRIPIGSLRYWALGVPDPALPAATDVDAEGRLAALEQGGWQVAIDQYRDAAGQSLPRRLTAEQGDARVRLVIDRWQIH